MEVSLLLSITITMAVKVLVNTLGQHIVADVKQVENKETKELIAYWVRQPRIAAYSRDDEGAIAVGFSPFCLLSDEQEFTIRTESVVAILEPREDVVTEYERIIEGDSVTSVPAEPAVTEPETVEPEVVGLTD